MTNMTKKVCICIALPIESNSINNRMNKMMKLSYLVCELDASEDDRLVSTGTSSLTRVSDGWETGLSGVDVASWTATSPASHVLMTLMVETDHDSTVRSNHSNETK